MDTTTTPRPVGAIGATIATRGRTYFDFEDPSASVIDIHDIAAGLSRCCRFAGQLPDDVPLYSVAQHSVHVSWLVPAEFALHGLLHDAAEAYMGDLPSPLKQLCPDFKAIEKRVEAVIWAHFGLPETLPPEVKHADYRMLHTEKRDISSVRGADHVWPDLEKYPPMGMRIRPWGQQDAMEMFLHRYDYLKTAHG